MSTKQTIRSDGELNEIIAQEKKKAAKGMFILVPGVVFLVLIAFTGSVLGIVLGVIIVCIGLILRASARNAIKACMTEAALVPALNSVFGNVTYDPEGHISESMIRQTDMGFSFRIDEITGSDYVRGSYKGVSVEFSDISLITVTETTDEEGNTTKSESTQFKGIWLICDFHKQFTADLLLREREGFLDRLDRNCVNTENEAFNKKFVIKSSCDHDVFYILTPHMMEYIQAMDQRANGRVYMRFRKEGKLILAIHNSRDSFEVGKIESACAESLREQFRSEVRYITDLIDELKLVKTLHEKG